MDEVLLESRDAVVGVGGGPDVVLRTLEEGFLQLVAVPGFSRASQLMSACHSQYHWSTFCTKHFQSLKTTGSSTSASESLIQSGSACLSR
jgi:hypothetical protein